MMTGSWTSSFAERTVLTGKVETSDSSSLVSHVITQNMATRGHV